MENFLYAKSIWKYLISVLHISSFQLGPSIPSNESIKVSVVAHDISNFDLCHLFHPRDPSIICMHMKSQRFSTVSAHYSICGGTAVSRWKLFHLYFSLNVSLMLIRELSSRFENYRYTFYQTVHTISLDFRFLHYSSARTIDLCTKQWYTFSGLIAEQMAVISFKLEKDFLCNFYCTIFGCNYGLLCTFFSFCLLYLFFLLQTLFNFLDSYEQYELAVQL